MHALFFEMRPKPGHLEHYFAHVDRLRPLLARHEGLRWLQRFRAMDDPDLILSHQHWADEDAILGWRRDPEHRRSQEAGRRVHFVDYRIRVGPEVDVRDDAPSGDRPLVVAVLAAAPTTPDASPGAAATGTAPIGRAFESMTDPGTMLNLIDADGPAHARALVAAARDLPGLRAVHVFAVSRDYGLTDRAAAPQ